jgi:putative ABC transport system permease protein
MWLVSLRDLQWRRRRFLVAAVGASVVFALTLLLAGFVSAFGNEAGRTVAAFHAESWIVHLGESGPFTSSAPLAPADVSALIDQLGPTWALPVAVLPATLHHGRDTQVTLIGVVPGGWSVPSVVKGRTLQARGDVVVDRRSKVGVGKTVVVAGRQFQVVGQTSGLTTRGGIASIYMPLADAQQVGFAGQPLASAVVTQGRLPTDLPAGLQVLSNKQVKSDLLGPLRDAIRTIRFLGVLLWLVAALIFGSILYLTAVERVRDFAVFKATGTTNLVLVAELAIEGTAVALVASALGTVLGIFLAPALPIPAEVPGLAYAAVPLIALLAAVPATIIGVRRALTVDPAAAFAGP